MIWLCAPIRNIDLSAQEPVELWPSTCQGSNSEFGTMECMYISTLLLSSEELAQNHYIIPFKYKPIHLHQIVSIETFSSQGTNGRTCLF